jgi:hypothetical protein
MFEILKAGYRNGLSPDEVLDELDNMGAPGGSSRKRKKGGRK